MQKDRENSRNIMGFSSKVLAGVVLMTAAGCMDVQSSAPVSSPTPEATPAASLEMGNSANQYFEGHLVPKIFDCPVECDAPNDLEAGNSVNEYFEGHLVPKIFDCNIECVPTEDYNTYIENENLKSNVLQTLNNSSHGDSSALK